MPESTHNTYSHTPTAQAAHFAKRRLSSPPRTPSLFSSVAQKHRKQIKMTASREADSIRSNGLGTRALRTNKHKHMYTHIHHTPRVRVVHERAICVCLTPILERHVATAPVGVCTCAFIFYTSFTHPCILLTRIHVRVYIHTHSPT